MQSTHSGGPSSMTEKTILKRPALTERLAQNIGEFHFL